jgi:hypothetical protein
MLWSWASLKRPQVVQPLVTFPASYGTRRFITSFTRAFHLYLSWARSIQSTPPKTIYKRPILMLFIHLLLGLPSGPFPLAFLPITYTCSFFLLSCHMSSPPHPPRLYNSNYTCQQHKSCGSLLCSFLNPPVTPSLFGPNILLNTLFWNTLSLCSSLNIREHVSHMFRMLLSFSNT